MARLKAVDLFCGAGGATKGIQRAGFIVHGVDIKPQPRYCGESFSQIDALDADLREASFVWASPPCQRYSAGARKWGTTEMHPDLIEPIRIKLLASGKPFVIENIETARDKLIDPILLCGTQFGLGVFRHRLFEIRKFNATLNLKIVPWEKCTCCDEFRCNIHHLRVGDCVCPAVDDWGPYDPYLSVPIGHIPHLKHDGRIGDGKYITVTGHSGGSSRRDKWKNGNVAAAKVSMGIDWMTWAEMAESIPPAYSEFISNPIFDLLVRGY